MVYIVAGGRPRTEPKGAMVLKKILKRVMLNAKDENADGY